MKIGSKYKDIFNDLVRLIKSEAFFYANNVDNKANKLNIFVQTDKDGNSKIISESTVFELDENIESYEQSIDTEITKSGAPWFASFRNEPVDSSDAEWIELINNIADKLHSNYSYLEFEKGIEPLHENVKYHENNVKKIIDKYYKRSGFKVSYNQANNSIDEDIYCVLLKLEMGSGVGSTQTVLCKVYFTKKNQNSQIIPLNSTDASSIDKAFKEPISNINNISEVGEIKKEDIFDICNAVNSIIEEGFTDSAIFNSKEDLEVIDRLLEDDLNSNVVILRCESVKILSITHCKWKSMIFDVTYKDLPVMRFVYGLDDKLSVKCLCCGNKIIEGISYSELDDSHAKLFKMHLQNMSCSTKNCQRRICSSKLITVKQGNVETSVCSDCMHLDVLYKDKAATPIITTLATFDSSRKELVLASLASTCACCKRSFVSLDNKYCSLCNMANKAKDNEIKANDLGYAKNLYKKYYQILPLNIRLRGINKNKYAFEDDEWLLIVVDNKIYHFNKLDILEKGYLTKFYINK